VHADVLGLEEELAAGRLAGGVEVLGDFGLAVDRHAAAGQGHEVDAPAATVNAEHDAVVDQALPVQALTDSSLVEQIHRPLLQDTGPDAAFDVRAAAALEDDALDAGQVQDLGEQQPRRAGAHDPDLRSRHHGRAGWCRGATPAGSGGRGCRPIPRPPAMNGPGPCAIVGNARTFTQPRGSVTSLSTIPM
jgi:hypothetical protein